MEFNELATKTPDELNKLLEEHSREKFNLRFNQASGELEKTHRARIVRRTIARIKTLINNPALAVAAVAKPAKNAKPAKKTAKKKEK